jgi:class 3 adenylate cyclase
MKTVAIFVITILGPLVFIAYLADDPTVRIVVINDSIAISVISIVWSLIASKSLAVYENLKIRHELLSAKFLLKDVHTAIYKGRTDLLERKVRRGMILNTDIRGSSALSKTFENTWGDFLSQWHERCSDIVSRHSGTILKTAGDEIIVAFGIFDETADLSDIPSLKKEVESAENAKWSQYTAHAMKAIDEMMVEFDKLTGSFFPNEIVRLGAGLDGGTLTKQLKGESDRLELDLDGQPLICSNRLQAFSKTLAEEGKVLKSSSVLCISPYAADYLNHFSEYRKIDLHKGEIRDFPGIKWILIKEFKKLNSSSQWNAA